VNTVINVKDSVKEFLDKLRRQADSQDKLFLREAMYNKHLYHVRSHRQLIIKKGKAIPVTGSGGT
jgi:uncharacterized protein YjlB